MIGSTGSASADQWNSNAQMNNPAKDMQMTQGKQSGWEEPSPPSQRRNIPSTYTPTQFSFSRPNPRQNG